MNKVEWGYVIAAIITAITAGLSVRRINKQKSFELLTKERLKQLESIRSAIKHLKMLTSASYICMSHRKRINAYSYELIVAIYSGFT